MTRIKKIRITNIPPKPGAFSVILGIVSFAYLDLASIKGDSHQGETLWVEGFFMEIKMSHHIAYFLLQNGSKYI
ncbi:hypothetical protein A2Z22_00710 [Candidatus Woesebacteria bacterium RBG_16_34_12]|uniref:Uncharacterized protein n=1 Tax=Candidatus Woesebacteria bacterium RBG_16_34_12 TaxID=1802480 RepID=A0A1F7XA60_9BACT|nr:MAG: hypothetical protein A2Z22_00710 [Candidatus Woesebacteria bacterium RBG_16_34_12]